jgi:hypothetical protein
MDATLKIIPMRNRIRFALGDKKASPASTPKLPSSSQIKSFLEGNTPEQDQKEWVVTNAGGMILCVRLADIAWVRAVENGVELRIGAHMYRLEDSFASWQAKLPSDRFARRGDLLLVNLQRLWRLDAALRARFRTPSGPASPPATAAISRRNRHDATNPRRGKETAPQYRRSD